MATDQMALRLVNQASLRLVNQAALRLVNHLLQDCLDGVPSVVRGGSTRHLASYFDGSFVHFLRGDIDHKSPCAA